MPIDLNKQWPAIMNYIDGIKPDGSNTYIPAFIRMCNENKKPLAKALGFEDGILTVEEQLQTDIKNRFPYSLNIIRSVLKETDEYKPTDEEIFNNKIEKTGAKLSRWLLALVNKEPDRLLTFSFNIGTSSSYLVHELKNMPSVGKYVKGNLAAVMEYTPLVHFEAFIQNFYSEIASLTKATYGFSIDPFVILRAASSDKFTSCFSPKNFNGRGPLHIALHPNTGVVYTTANNVVSGRAWILFDKDMAKFCVMKSYGFMSEELVQKICISICQALDEKSVWSKSKKAVDIFMHPVPEGWYIDPVHALYFSDKSNRSSSIHLGTAGRAMCLLCGATKCGYSSLICDECAAKLLIRCNKCGNNILKSANNMRYPLCSKCVGKVAVCPVCGAVMEEGKPCPHCAWDNWCSLCGVQQDKTLKRYNGQPVCDKCADLLTAAKCECCGTTGFTYPYKGKALCLDCMSSIDVMLTSASHVYDQTKCVPYISQRMKQFLRDNPDISIEVKDEQEDI